MRTGPSELSENTLLACHFPPVFGEGMVASSGMSDGCLQICCYNIELLMGRKGGFMISLWARDGVQI